MLFEKEVVLIYAGTNGYFDDVSPAEVPGVSAKLIDYLEKMHRDTILEKIKISGELTQDVEEKLKKATAEFKKM